MKIVNLDETKLAKNDQEYLSLIASDADWIVRSLKDLSALRSAEINPVAKLSETAFQAFQDGLVFKHGGLAHSDYKPLMNELDLNEILQVFRHFGLHPYKTIEATGYSCMAGGFCNRTLFNACLPNCPF